MRARNQMHPDLSGCGNDRLILLLKGLFFPFDICTGYLLLFANLDISSLWSKANFLFLLWIIYFWKKPLVAWSRCIQFGKDAMLNLVCPEKRAMFRIARYSRCVSHYSRRVYISYGMLTIVLRVGAYISVLSINWTKVYCFWSSPVRNKSKYLDWLLLVL
jgi:hypothetical protein